MQNRLKLYLIIILGGIVLVSCASKKEVVNKPNVQEISPPSDFSYEKLQPNVENTSTHYNDSIEIIINSITKEDLKKHVSIISSDDFQGRKTGEKGQKKTTTYLAEYYKNLNIYSPINSNDYFQEVPATYLPDGIKDSENVLAYFPGSDGTKEYVVITAHLDHIGIKKGKIYNGADDNGSGTAALLELSEAIKIAQQKGFKPKKGILFLHITAEELGLYGSRYYVENPVLPLNKTICNINIDMIGRKDDRHNENPNYLYSIGSDRISKELHTTIFEVLEKYKSDLEIDLFYDEPGEPSQLYYRSDHYNFALLGIPSVFFSSGMHDDYHKPSDDMEKLEFNAYEKRVRYIFSLLWEIINQSEPLKIDK